MSRPRPQPAPLAPAEPNRAAELARGYTEAAIKTLVGMLDSKEATDRNKLDAAEALLDRGWGKVGSSVSAASAAAPSITSRLDALPDEEKVKLGRLLDALVKSESES